MKRIMRAFKIHEISGVDKPAQAHARAAIMKRHDIMAATKSTTGLRAIGKDSALLKKLGLLKGFGVNKATLTESIKSIVEDPNADVDALLEKTINQFGDAVEDDITKALAGGEPDVTSDEDKMSAALAKALGLADSASLDEIVAAVAAKDAALAKANADADAVTKAAHDAELAKATEEKAVLAKRVADLEEAAEVVKYADLAKSLGLVDAHGEVLRKARGSDAEANAKLDALIKSLTAQIDTAKLFAELGVSKGADVTDPYAEITAKAEEIKKANPKLTIEKAKAQVIEDPANAELMKRYRAANKAA